MSLFPAYVSLLSTSKDDDTQKISDTPSSSSATSMPSNQTEKKDDWLTNSSFQVVNASTSVPAIVVQSDDEDDNPIILDNKDDDDDSIEKTPSKKRPISPASKKHSKKKKKKKKKKHHKRSAKSDDTSSENDERSIEFTGQEEYYVDKSSKPTKACDLPRYHVNGHILGTQTRLFKSKKEKTKRYFQNKFDKESGDEAEGSGSTATKTYRMTEDEFLAKTKIYNRSFVDDSSDIDQWLEFVRFQEHFYMKMTKLQLAERKMEILNRALRENPSNDRLYREYINVLEWAYPSFEVSKFLETLIEKDPSNYILWNAQIMATQGSMARCRVPDVLALYEKCMKNMYKRNRCDEVTLKLFNSCALFLRQAGLSEHFFALLKLALELNVHENRFSQMTTNDPDPNELVQYEELVLKCGLPMNEIWLRVEKLRQNYYFLPCSMGELGTDDPQRIVLNDDILHYIYPMANGEYAFRLVCIVMKLLKIPLIDNTQLKQYTLNGYSADDGNNLCDFDSIEDITPMFLHRTILGENECMDAIFWQLIRDYTIGPSYLTTLIGCEHYIHYISEMLLQLADCYVTPSPEHVSKRKLFVWLLLRLERIIMIFEVHMSKWNDSKSKRLRTKVKNILKSNRNCLTFYVEFAQIEYDLKQFERAEQIYATAIDQSDPRTDDDCTRSDYWYTCISFVEMLMREKNTVKALNLLNAMASDSKLSATMNDGDNDNGAGILSTPLTEASNLLTAKKLDERLSAISFIERNVTIMDVVQIFQPDYLLCVIKANIYHKLLWRKSKADAVQQMEKLLKTFCEKNPRHQFIREQLYELYADLLQYKMITSPHGSDDCGISTRLWHISTENAQFEMIGRALDEFPTNTYLLRCAAICNNQQWYRVQGLFSKHASPISTIFLFAAVRYRCEQYAQFDRSIVKNAEQNAWTMLTVQNTDDLQQAYKIRILNFLQKSVEYDTQISKNSLVWRLYLRYLLEIGYGYEKSQSLLLKALNECPWNKALYLDGTICVPQQLPHLQDLIIEKHLRIYAMPEELEILRNFED